MLAGSLLTSMESTRTRAHPILLNHLDILRLLDHLLQLVLKPRLMLPKIIITVAMLQLQVVLVELPTRPTNTTSMMLLTKRQRRSRSTSLRKRRKKRSVKPRKRRRNINMVSFPSYTATNPRNTARKKRMSLPVKKKSTIPTLVVTLPSVPEPSAQLDTKLRNITTQTQIKLSRLHQVPTTPLRLRLFVTVKQVTPHSVPQLVLTVLHLLLPKSLELILATNFMA